ncbi:hypothetical protein CLV30_104215 [Haloactinopolyspora alba]|uniref:Uncharacterized protein n=1 Tax=Haloactinopolyspora alba TaxID=648780 RepID=A0A2P8E792_9ACTN|nr:hypothetical protein CLV30_104215 [Haloactinopolyspora alba]
MTDPREIGEPVPHGEDCTCSFCHEDHNSEAL